MTNNHYTDEVLIERASAAHALPGDLRRKEILLPLPLEVRPLIDAEAHTMGNYQGGRHSDNMRRAVATWKATGRFPFQERAKAHRDAENKANEGNLGRRIILPMN
jgi:hypothetical protein